MPRSVPVSLLTLALVLVSHSAAALSLGREIPLTPPVIDVAPGAAKTARVASNGRGFLVVWNEPSLFATADVRAARLDANGVLLDEISMLVAAGAGAVTSIASDGRDYVVVYDCAGNTTTAPGVCLARIDAATGEVFRGARIARAAAGAIAPMGSGYVLAYQATNPKNGRLNITEAVAIGTRGNVAGEPFRASGVYASFAPPAIASNGREALVVYSNGSSLRGALISDRQVIAPDRELTQLRPSVGPAAFGWSVGSDGSSFLVVWHQNTGVAGGRYTSDLRLLPVTNSGEPGTTTVVPIEHAGKPFVTWTGTKYIVTFTRADVVELGGSWWRTPADIGAISVTPEGGTGEVASVVATADRETGGAAAWNGSAMLVVWERVHRMNASQIEARIVRGSQLDDGEPPVIVSKALTRQSSVAAAESNGRVVAAWDENRGELQISKVFVQRLGESGSPEGEAIAVPESTRHQVRPAVAGSAVAWLEEDVGDLDIPARTDVYVAFMNGEGAVGPAIHLGQAARLANVEIAAAGGVHLVVWPQNGEIVGVRVTPDRGVLDLTPLLISRGEENEDSPAVASDGRNFFVAWHFDVMPDVCLGIGCFPNPGLRVAAVSQSGALMRMPYDVSAPQVSKPVVVWNGSAYAVFWARTGGFVYAQLFDFNANRIGSEREIRGGGTPIDVAWNGSEYLVATRQQSRLEILHLDSQMNAIDVLRAPATAHPDAAIVGHADATATLVHARRAGHVTSSRVVARRLSDEEGTMRRRAAGRRSM